MLEIHPFLPWEFKGLNPHQCPPPPPVETAGPDSRPYHGFAPPPVPTTTAPEMAWEIRYNST